MTVTEAQILIKLWRVEYNEARPHMSLDYLTPAEFEAKWRAGDHTLVGALPTRRTSLSLWGLPDGKDEEKAEHVTPCPSVQSPATPRLGVVSSGALSSARVNQLNTAMEHRLP